MLRDNLRAAIKASGLVVKEVAYKAGISNRALEKWLASDAVEPKAIAFVKVCKALGVSPFDIAGEEEPKKTYEDMRLLALARRHRKALEALDRLDELTLATVNTQIEAVAGSAPDRDFLVAEGEAAYGET